MMDSCKAEYDFVKKQVTELEVRFGLAIVFSSRFGHHGTFKMKKDTEDAIEEEIKIAERARRSLTSTSLKDLRKQLQSLICRKRKGEKYTTENIPEWWENTGIPFTSPTHKGYGVLTKEEIIILIKAAKDFYARTPETAGTDTEKDIDSPMIGTSTPKEMRRTIVSTALRLRKTCLDNHVGQTSKARRNLFDKEQSSNSSMVPLSARAKILDACDQIEPITFIEAFTEKMISQCKKIGEGVYGEVFKAVNNNGDSVAIKIIPIEGDFEVNGEPQIKYNQILSEIVIAKELSNLRTSSSNYMTTNYCEVINVSCVKGRYPEDMIKQWDLFNIARCSENDRPDMFPEEQLYIAFEFADCGSDLESYKFDTVQQAKSVLTQVGHALAVAEKTVEFEHRDLHWGNVMVRPTDKEEITFRLMGKPVTVPSKGVEACVIDFTMSRLTKDGCTFFIPIPDDDTLFKGNGDYQFDIYREMKKENKGNWQMFRPHSNVLWLHYLADKLAYSTKYPNQYNRDERDLLRKLREFMPTMLCYSSAADMVVNSIFMNT